MRLLLAFLFFIALSVSAITITDGVTTQNCAFVTINKSGCIPAKSPPPVLRMGNLSVRGQVSGGEGALIAGFSVSEDQRVIIRAKGPSLVPYGIVNALANPMLTLVSGQSVIASNDNWQSENASQIVASGYAPSHALESAILVTLKPGAYTAIVTGPAFTSGVAILEVFAL